MLLIIAWSVFQAGFTSIVQYHWLEDISYTHVQKLLKMLFLHYKGRKGKVKTAEVINSRIGSTWAAKFLLLRLFRSFRPIFHPCQHFVYDLVLSSFTAVYL